MYQIIWTPTTGEQLACETMDTNPMDLYVAVGYQEKILMKFKYSGIVKLYQFAKFSSLPIFFLIWYICTHNITHKKNEKITQVPLFNNRPT